MKISVISAVSRRWQNLGSYQPIKDVANAQPLSLPSILGFPPRQPAAHAQPWGSCFTDHDAHRGREQLFACSSPPPAPGRAVPEMAEPKPATLKPPWNRH